MPKKSTEGRTSFNMGNDLARLKRLAKGSPVSAHKLGLILLNDGLNRLECGEIRITETTVQPKPAAADA